MTRKRRGEGEEVTEVSAVFVAVTREAGVFSGTASPRLAPELVTLALHPQLILRRSDMTDRWLTIPRSDSTPVISSSVALIVQHMPSC